MGYAQAMRKIGGFVVIGALVMGLGASNAQASPAEPLQAAAASAGGFYATMSPSALGDMRAQFCESFAEGFTVEDAADVQAELFGAEAGEQVRIMGEAVRSTGC